MSRQIIDQITAKVRVWAREYATDSYHYGSMASYWDDARSAGIVSDDEYEMVRSYLGDRFYWSGD